MIKDTDAVFVGAHSEMEVSHLDVYIYEEPDDNLYHSQTSHRLLLDMFTTTFC